MRVGKSIVFAVGLLMIAGGMFLFFQEAGRESETPNLEMPESGTKFPDKCDRERDGNPVPPESPNMQDAAYTVSALLEKEARFALFFSCASTPQKDILLHANIPMRSASMIKVFILGYAMERAKDGTLDLQESVTLDDEEKVGGSGILSSYPSGAEFSVLEMLRLMITESDNTATNIMIDRLGMENINQYIQNRGYTETILQRNMMDFLAAARGMENYTSARDLGKFFTGLYNHQCVDAVNDAVMIDFLKAQTDNEALPKALPYFTVAHKTGELIGAYHDGGILYGDKDYILIILTDDYENREETINAIQEAAKYLVFGESRYAEGT